MKLSDIRAPKSATKDRKRVGRGHGSGYGKTAGRGTKGHKARSGGSTPRHFQGGQTPIHQQLPYKRGFTNLWRARYNLVNLEQLAGMEDGSAVTPESLLEAGLVRDAGLPLKILGTGELGRALHITAHKVSEGARQKIEAAGGSVTLVEFEAGPRRPRGHTMAAFRARDARQEGSTSDESDGQEG